MASGETLIPLLPNNNNPPAWVFAPFNSGSTQPSLGDTIWDDAASPDANGVLEYLGHVSGTWAGTDEVGYMLLSNVVGTFTAANWTANSTTPANHGTFTAVATPAFATPGVIRSDTLVLNFDASDNEVALFPIVLPRHYGGNGITINIGIVSTSTTGDMSFAAFLKSYTNDVDNLGDVGTDPSGLKVFADPQFNTAFAPATAIGDLRVDSIALTDGAQMDSLAAGEYGQLLLMRDAQDTTNDDMAADASLVFIEIQETP